MPAKRPGRWEASVAAVLHSGGCPLTADRVAAWTATRLDAESLRGWTDAAPAGMPVGDWLDACLAWADARMSPDEATALVGLPAGDPRLPTAQDLAVMAGLARVQ